MRTRDYKYYIAERRRQMKKRKLRNRALMENLTEEPIAVRIDDLVDVIAEELEKEKGYDGFDEHMDEYMYESDNDVIDITEEEDVELMEGYEDERIVVNIDDLVDVIEEEIMRERRKRMLRGRR